MPRILTAEIEVNGRRKIVNADDPRATGPAPEPLSVPQSPEDVAKLKKPEVVELLEAHGADTNGKLPELKKRLSSVMFTGL